MAKGKGRGYSGFDLAIGPSYKDGWNRAAEPTELPDYQCTNCRRRGHCYKWHLVREINAFGKLIEQRMQAIECRYCLNEYVVGSLDIGPKKGAKEKKFNLRTLSSDDMKRLMEVMKREIQAGRIKV